jgi:hypothetical protein
VKPDGEARGFVYFQRATDNTGHLELAWTAHDAKTDAEVATLKVRFNVLH